MLLQSYTLKVCHLHPRCLENSSQKGQEASKSFASLGIIDVRSSTPNFAAELPPCGLKINALRFKIRELKIKNGYRH